MNLKEIGEFGFIKKISRGCLIRPDNIIKAIGDDGTIYDIKALETDGTKLDVKGVKR